MGSWLAIERIKGTDADENTFTGNVVAIDTSHCIIEGQDKLIAAVGLKDIIVVDTPDATLICHKEKTGEIKKLLDLLRSQNKETYL